MLTPTVRVPIFEGGRAQGRRLEADAELRRRRAELDDYRGRIDLEVRTAVLDGQAPSAAQLGLMALWLSIALGSSLLVFIRYQPRFAEEL